MECTNCCEAFIGPCEGYHFIKDANKMVLCRCCKNEYLALGGMGWTLIGQKTEEEIKKIKEIEEFWRRKDAGEFDEEEEEDYEVAECEDCGDIHELTKFEKFNDKLYCGFCYEELEKK
jgi:hypothetical protein